MFLYQTAGYRWLHAPVTSLEPPAVALSLGRDGGYWAEERAAGASIAAAPEEQQAETLQTKTPTAFTLCDELWEGHEAANMWMVRRLARLCPPQLSRRDVQFWREAEAGHWRWDALDWWHTAGSTGEGWNGSALSFLTEAKRSALSKAFFWPGNQSRQLLAFHQHTDWESLGSGSLTDPKGETARNPRDSSLGGPA